MLTVDFEEGIMSLITFEDVSRIYENGDHKQKALDHVNMSLEEGKFVVILGPSGAGKSTLLNLLGGLDSPTEGKITVNGKDISGLSGNELADYRASTVGFVFQFYNLIPTLTVHENVTLVKEIAPDALFRDGNVKGSGTGRPSEEFPVRALRRRTAACLHCQGLRKTRKFYFVMNLPALLIPKPVYWFSNYS